MRQVSTNAVVEIGNLEASQFSSSTLNLAFQVQIFDGIYDDNERGPSCETPTPTPKSTALLRFDDAI